MKELKDYSDLELLQEISKREQDKLNLNSKILPDEFYDYKIITQLNWDDDKQYFHAKVDDGSEGHDYIIELSHELFEGTDEDDQLLYDTVKHAYVTAAIEGGWDADSEDIQINEIGRYGCTFLNVIKPTEEDEDD